jgi:hypothetical protein
MIKETLENMQWRLSEKKKRIAIRIIHLCFQFIYGAKVHWVLNLPMKIKIHL